MVAGVPCLFTLHDGRYWEIERPRAVPREMLDAIALRLDAIVDAYGGPSDGPFGPRQIQEAADLLGGVPYVEPKAESPAGSIH
jgi:hypothetical protein